MSASLRPESERTPLWIPDCVNRLVNAMETRSFKSNQMKNIRRLLKHAQEGEYWGELGEDAARDLEEISSRMYALENMCNILNKCGFQIDGSSQDTEYVLSADKFINEVIEQYHTNKR